MCFFFQAEDGIRDLVRSRGLGDVYKRQGERCSLKRDDVPFFTRVEEDFPFGQIPRRGQAEAVSYTHLTLPTSDLV